MQSFQDMAFRTVMLLLIFHVLQISSEETQLGIPWKKGVCKNEIQTPQPNFRPERFFTGVWYEEQLLGTMFSHISRKCVAAKILYEGGTANVTVSEYIPFIFSTVCQNFQIVLKDKEPIFNVSVPFVGMRIVDMSVSVLSTDYDNYALLYSCSPSPLGMDDYISEIAFILRRKRGDKSKQLFLREISWNNGLIYEDFEYQENKGCPKNSFP